MSNESSRSGAPAPEAYPTVSVRITPVIDAEFRRRDMFPDLRAATAVRLVRGTAIHLLSLDRAKSIGDDAWGQAHADEDFPRGVKNAYLTLWHNIRCAVWNEERHGLPEDPGLDGAMRLAATLGACFKHGDEVLYLETYTELTVRAIVVGAYGMYAVPSDEGRFIRRDGQRLDYRYGYLVRLKNSRATTAPPFFAEAFRLRDPDGKLSYLGVVTRSACSAEVRHGQK